MLRMSSLFLHLQILNIISQVFHQLLSLLLLLIKELPVWSRQLHYSKRALLIDLLKKSVLLWLDVLAFILRRLFKIVLIHSCSFCDDHVDIGQIAKDKLSGLHFWLRKVFNCSLSDKVLLGFEESLDLDQILFHQNVENFKPDNWVRNKMDLWKLFLILNSPDLEDVLQFWEEFKSWGLLLLWF